MLVTELPERFQNKISVQPDGRWLWTGSKQRTGYGRVVWPLGGPSVGAHRVTYQLARPEERIDGLDVHHECKVRTCVNPDHLRAVTHRENLEMDGVLKRLSKRKYDSRCTNGHERTPENIYVSSANPLGERRCRECGRIRSREYRKRAKKRAVADG